MKNITKEEYSKNYDREVNKRRLRMLDFKIKIVDVVQKYIDQYEPDTKLINEITNSIKEKLVSNGYIDWDEPIYNKNN